MLPDGSLEPFDWQFCQPFKHWREGPTPSDPDGVAFPGSPRQKRQNTEPVTVDKAMEFIDEALGTYQAYRITQGTAGNQFQFPNAIFLDRGTRFRCIETKEIYKVGFHEHDRRGVPTGVVILEAASGRELKSTDRLIAERGEKNSINFYHAWPKSMPQLYDFNEQGDLIEDGTAFTDTITWSVVTSQPGSLERQPFAGTREIAPRFREIIIETGVNCDYARMISGQLFDTVVQFDIWSHTPKRATQLLNWFNEFMQVNRWVFLYNGVQRIYFWKQLADALTTRWRNDIVSVSTQWYFRTEHLINRRIRRIRDITLEVDSLTQGEQWVQSPVIIDPAGCIDPTGIIITSIVDGTGTAIVDTTGDC